ncbi:hypothetical protein TNCV_3269641, partial [Trichonephila clavipes]
VGRLSWPVHSIHSIVSPTYSGIPLHDGKGRYRPEKSMTDSPKGLSQLVAIYFVVFQLRADSYKNESCDGVSRAETRVEEIRDEIRRFRLEEVRAKSEIVFSENEKYLLFTALPKKKMKSASFVKITYRGKGGGNYESLPTLLSTLSGILHYVEILSGAETSGAVNPNVRTEANTNG